MTTLDVSLEGDNCWPDMDLSRTEYGELVGIAFLPADERNPDAIGFRVKLAKDGSEVLAQTTAKLFDTAASALIVRHQQGQHFITDQANGATVPYPGMEYEDEETLYRERIMENPDQPLTLVDKRYLETIPGDPSEKVIRSELDLGAKDWLLTTGGDYRSAAVRTVNFTTDTHETCVALEWPVRVNHSDQKKLVRLLISPDDIPGLVATLTETANWINAAAELGRLEVPDAPDSF